jgi:hypothetical protein
MNTTTNRQVSEISLRVDKPDHISVHIPSTDFSDNGHPESTSRKNSMETACCPICWDSEKKELIQPFACKHSFCQECLQEYLRNQVNSLKVVNIPCPSSGCSEIFDEKTIQTILDKPTFEIYQTAVINKMKIREVQVKICPRSGCSREFKPTLKSQYTKCRCGEKICNICYNSWHEGKTCLEEIDPNFQAYARSEGIKFCVMCKTEEMRVEGCKHITCPICDYEWCWDCGREFKYLHEIKCPKEWSPIPPTLTPYEKWQLRWRDSSKLGRAGLLLVTILLSPLILLGTMLFWPLWEYDYISDLSMKHPLRSFGVLCKTMIIGLGGSLTVIPAAFFIILCFVLFAPLAIPALLITHFETRGNGRQGENQQEQQQARPIKKRWMRRNQKNFSYTPNARPEAEAQNQGEENPDAVVLEVNEAPVVNIPAEDVRIGTINDMVFAQSAFGTTTNMKPYIL